MYLMVGRLLSEFGLSVPGTARVYLPALAVRYLGTCVNDVSHSDWDRRAV